MFLVPCQRTRRVVTPKKSASLTRGSVVLTASRVVTVGIAYALNVFLARRLGPDLFGLLAVVITVLAWFELFVAEALPLWVVRIVDSDSDGPLIPRSYLYAQLGLSLVLGAVLFVITPLLARLFGTPDDMLLFRVAALDLPLFALFTLLQGVILGSRAYVLQATTDIGYSLAKLGATVLLVGSGLAVMGAIMGSLTASVVGASLAFALIAWRFGGRKLVGKGTATAAHTTGDAIRGSVVPAVLILSQSLAVSADLWVVKAILPAADAGFYRAAGLFAHVPIMLSSGIVWGMYAAYSDAHRRGDTARMRHYVSQVTRLLVAAGGIWIAVIVPTANSLMTFIFSAEYAPGGTVLAILGAGMGVGMLGVAMAPLLLIEGRARGVLVGALSILAAEIGAAVALTPRVGATGTATAVMVAYVAGTVLAFGAMRKHITFRLVSTFTRLLAPAVVVGVAAWAIHPAANAWLFAWYAMFAAAFAGMLFLTGAITRDDIAAIKGGLA